MMASREMASLKKALVVAIPLTFGIGYGLQRCGLKLHERGGLESRVESPALALSEEDNQPEESFLPGIKDPLIYDARQYLPDERKEPQAVEHIVKPISYKISDFIDDSDEVLLARMIFGEARGCERLEKIAVGYTAINRARDGKRWNGETVRDAILTPEQYSCFNEGDVNLEQIRDPYEYDKNSFDNCLEVARGILSGNYKDPTNGATHYFNPELAKPKWARKLDKIGKIPTGNGLSAHEFYLEH